MYVNPRHPKRIDVPIITWRKMIISLMKVFCSSGIIDLFPYYASITYQVCISFLALVLSTFQVDMKLSVLMQQSFAQYNF